VEDWQVEKRSKNMLEHLFGSKTRLKLLQLFFRHPDRSFFVREICRAVGSHLNAVRRELSNLETLGIIAVTDKAEVPEYDQGSERAKYFGLQKDFLLFGELKSLLLKAQIMEEQAFVSELKAKGGLIKYFVLTGIFTDEPQTNTDILLVGKIKPVSTAKIIRDYEKAIDRPIRYTIMSEDEYHERKEIGDKFLYGILESKHLLIFDEINNI